MPALHAEDEKKSSWLGRAGELSLKTMDVACSPKTLLVGLVGANLLGYHTNIPQITDLFQKANFARMIVGALALNTDRMKAGLEGAVAAELMNLTQQSCWFSSTQKDLYSMAPFVAKKFDLGSLFSSIGNAAKAATKA
jgi:hypothetical protein